MKYKDLQNKVHEIDPAFIHLLPVGCIEITDEEAAQLLAPPPPTAQEVSSDNYKAMIRRRASKLTPIEAVLLLKSIGE